MCFFCFLIFFFFANLNYFCIRKTSTQNKNYEWLNEWMNKRSQQIFIGLQQVFSITVFRLPWRPEDVLKISHETSWRRLGRQKIVTLKMPSRHAFKTSSRSLGHKQNVYWGYLYLTNLNLNLTNLYLTNLYLTNLRWTKKALIKA